MVEKTTYYKNLKCDSLEVKEFDVFSILLQMSRRLVNMKRRIETLEREVNNRNISIKEVNLHETVECDNEFEVILSNVDTKNS